MNQLRAVCLSVVRSCAAFKDCLKNSGLLAFGQESYYNRFPVARPTTIQVFGKPRKQKRQQTWVKCSGVQQKYYIHHLGITAVLAIKRQNSQ